MSLMLRFSSRRVSEAIESLPKPMAVPLMVAYLSIYFLYHLVGEIVSFLFAIVDQSFAEVNSWWK